MDGVDIGGGEKGEVDEAIGRFALGVADIGAGHIMVADQDIGDVGLGLEI